ncbi:MAG: YidH family protein [Acidimicrobiia bacterium]
MSTRPPPWWPTGGDEPDPRWTLANERTLLAYERTALGLVVAGLAVGGSRAVADAPLWFSAIGLPMILLGAAVALEGRRRFIRAQGAMRAGEPLPAPLVVSFLPWGIVALASLGLLAVLLELASPG